MTDTATQDHIQFVEGFARILKAPGSSEIILRSKPAQNVDGSIPPGARTTLDFQGQTQGWWTLEWWRHPEMVADPYELVWETAVPLEKRDTVFSFVGSSHNLTDHTILANQAKIFINGQEALTFDLGTRLVYRWKAGDCTLEFTPKHVQMPFDGYHRQFQQYGNSGIYHLRVPARLVEVGKSNQIKVEVLAPRSDYPNYFMVLDRQHTLDVSLESHEAQIAQLQQEVIQLKRALNVVARRAYREYFPERLPAQEVVIYQNGRAHIHPPDVIQLQNGDLLMTFREAMEHLSDDGHIVVVRSRDGGLTWGERQVVVDNYHQDDRETSLTQLRDGTILMVWWANKLYDPTGQYGILGPVVDTNKEQRVYRSTDNGYTWEDTSGPINSDPLHMAVASERIIELPDGTLLMPTYHWDRRSSEDLQGSSIYRSKDGGRNWELLSVVANTPSGGQIGVLSEPGLTITKSGKLLVMMRTPEGHHIFASSIDAGQTWSEPRVMDMGSWGHPANLITLQNGDILCTYGRRQRIQFTTFNTGNPGLDQPSSVYIAISHDEGETWPLEERSIIRDDFLTMDMGYPSSVQLQDGRILTTYYCNLLDRFYIAGSIYRLPGQ
ncbi:MAG: exo-alpha-sialidase [Chloroflexi bacterium]|nr:exo-alpha-sialidase [Chloroflexota bacterium]